MAPPISPKRPPVVTAPKLPDLPPAPPPTNTAKAAPVDTFELPKDSPEMKNALVSINAWRKDLGKPPVTMDQLPKALAEFQKENGIQAERPGKLDGPTRERLYLLDRPEYDALPDDARARVRDFLKTGKNGELVMDALQDLNYRGEDVFKLASSESFAKAEPASIRETFRQLVKYDRDGLPQEAKDNLVELATHEDFPKNTYDDQQALLQLQRASPEAPGPLTWLVHALPIVKHDPAVRREVMEHLQKFTRYPDAMASLSMIATTTGFENMPVSMQRTTLSLLDRYADDPAKMVALRGVFLKPEFMNASVDEQRAMMKKAVGEK